MQLIKLLRFTHTFVYCSNFSSWKTIRNSGSTRWKCTSRTNTSIRPTERNPGRRNWPWTSRTSCWGTCRSDSVRVLSSGALHHCFPFQAAGKKWRKNHKPQQAPKRLQMVLEDTKGLWPLGECHISRTKGELAWLIDDLREVMPYCVIKDVRGRWSNPANVPYQGHRRS